MKNAFSVFVFGKYERYLPYYVYSIEKAYPNTDVIIFYNSILSLKIKRNLKGKPHVIVYEEFYKEYNYFDNYKMYGGGGLTLLRYLIPEEYFKGYQNVYFGDVDILILKEPENLFHFHEIQAKKSNLPFSNKVRLLETGALSERLTGLHFVVVKSYFAKINKVIIDILAKKTVREQLLVDIRRDEELLYAINKLAFNFSPQSLIHNKVPLHGVHFGLFRSSRRIDKPQIEKDSLLSYQEIKKQLAELVEDKDFKIILYQFFNMEMIKLLVLLELPIPFFLKIKYKWVTTNFFRIFRKLLNKIKK
ncbi:hypothetical protein QRD02_12935 [Aequorivita sp. SDUM287046]|uniref:Glycosyl transferase n=1 Tax=Aequorivita aurantiaca TaxID=3053356 RepID=A0ABT8DMT2_9FLAO|nr:hypothetical protein [Aequorivita aurantiaca]MDN3725286.1 hypothetical protein [Aequorivita aurantiaca]